MTPILALVWKEVQHHLFAVVGFVVLVLGGLIISLTFTLDQEMPTLLVAATGWVYYAIPLLCMFVFGRLIVQEREDGTHEMLASLPLPPALLGMVRWSLAVSLITPLSVIGLLGVAVVVSRHEVIGGGWLLQLCGQVALYATAWCSVCFLVGHLGRFRWIVWLGGLELVWAIGEQWPALWGTYLWHGVLIDPITVTRLLPPWGAVPAAVGWTVGGLVGGLWLASWRGGVLPARWFEPGYARGTVVTAIAVCWVVGTVIEQAADVSGPPTGSGGSALSTEVAAAEGKPLHHVAAEASATLDALASEIGVEAWPWALVVSARDLRAPTLADGASPIRVAVDRAALEEDAIRGMIGDVLFTRTGAFVFRDPDASWVVRGAAAWLRPPDRLLPARAGWAVGYTSAPPLEALSDLGIYVGEAWAWAGLLALEDLGGRPAVLAALGHVLRPRPAQHLLGAVTMRVTLRDGWLERVTGVPPDRLRDRWEARLRPLAAERPAWPALSRAPDRGTVIVDIEGAPAPGDQLCWVTVDPLRRAPHWLDNEDCLVLPDGASSVGLLVDPRARVAVRVSRFDPAAGAPVSAPWTVLEVPP